VDIRRRRSLRSVLAGSLVIGGLTTFSLAATTALMTGTASATPATLFSSTTPGTYLFTVPGGVNSVSITAVGGSGGAEAAGFGAAIPGGEGGVTTETVFVNPDDSLAVTVGADGQPDTAGGSGGTGYGNGGNGFAGGGGGGGSAVIDSTQGNTPLAVSGGGGGSSEVSVAEADSGFPGGAELQGGGADQAGPSADFLYWNGLTYIQYPEKIVGPGAGTLTGPGTGGCSSFAAGCAASGSGPTGGSGAGGGPDCCAQPGGGGGYEGGGAGISGGAGGGASYPVPATQWDTTATPSVTITTLSIATTGLPAATPGTPYGPETLQAANLGSSTSPYVTTLKWKKITLPKGLRLSSAGVLSGTPNQKLATPTSITVQVTETVRTFNSKGKPVKIKASVQATIPFA